MKESLVYDICILHFVVSRVNSNFKLKSNWWLSVIKIGYIKNFANKDLFSSFKNNRPYFFGLQC